MKSSTKNILYLAIVLLLIVIVTLIGFIINSNNVINNYKKTRSEQLTETASDNAYVAMADHLSEVSNNSGGPITIPTFSTYTGSGSEDYAGSKATLTLDVTNYTTLTIESLKLTGRGNGKPTCTITTDDGGKIYSVTTSSNSSSTTKSNLSFDISNSTTLTIAIAGSAYGASGTDKMTNIVIK